MVADANVATTNMSCGDEQVSGPGLIDSPETNTRGQLTHYFNALTQLIVISERVLVSTNRDTSWHPSANSDLSSTHDPRSGASRLYSQLSLSADQEGRLSEWLEGLPEHLRFDHYNPDVRVRKQQRTLEIRYLHARLMVHRQTVIPAIRYGLQQIGNGDKFLLNAVPASINQCIECACTLVKLVKEYSSQQSLGPWWMNVQCKYTLDEYDSYANVLCI